MRRVMALCLILPLLLLSLLSGCDTGPAQDLRLFTERFNRAAHGRAALAVDHFAAVQHEDGSMQFSAFVGYSELITVQTLANGRVHTVSLTGLPDVHQAEFFASALAVLQAFTGLESDPAERKLQEIFVGISPVLGLQTTEYQGVRLSYAANEAGRYVRLSCLRHLPPQMEFPTLREFITDLADPAP